MIDVEDMVTTQVCGQTLSTNGSTGTSRSHRRRNKSHNTTTAKSVFGKEKSDRRHHLVPRREQTSMTALR